MSLLLGCTSPNDVFSGRWESTSTSGYQGVIQGVPVLALGHFGQEVAGIVYYTVPGGSQFRSPCACAYVDHLRNSASTGRLQFETRCDSATVAAYWDLTLTDDPLDGEVYLEGTVSWADGTGTSLPVSFLLREPFVRESDKLCPPGVP